MGAPRFQRRHFALYCPLLVSDSQPSLGIRFVATIEHCLQNWLSKEIARARERQGGVGEPLRLSAQLQHRLPFRSDAYTLSLFLPPCAAVPRQRSGDSSGGGASRTGLLPPGTLAEQPHKEQEWLGLGPFLRLAPNSYSGRVLDEAEAHTLLSASAAALGHTGLALPLLMPVHDALREGLQGLALARSGRVLRLDSDSLHSGSLPPSARRLLHAGGQLALLADRLAPHAPAAAAACRASLAGAGDEEAAAAAAGMEASARKKKAILGIKIAVRACFHVPHSGDLEAEGPEEVEVAADDWDADAAWRPWAAQADPVACLELDLVWRFNSGAAALAAEAAEEERREVGAVGEASEAPHLSPSAAEEWRLAALGQGHERDTGLRGFLLRPADKRRLFLRLQSGEAARGHGVQAPEGWRAGPPVPCTAPSAASHRLPNFLFLSHSLRDLPPSSILAAPARSAGRSGRGGNGGRGGGSAPPAG